MIRDTLYGLYDRLLEVNRYALAFGLFVLWMCTLAEVGVFRMVETQLERQTIEARIAETQGAIATLDAEIAELDALPGAKETHAREQYYMHKSNEDVYVFR